jgi:hypothetical protein
MPVGTGVSLICMGHRTATLRVTRSEERLPTFVRAAVMCQRQRFRLLSREAMDHEYRNVFYHSEAHRWIECPVLEQRALLPKLPTECCFAPELFREMRNKPQRG